MRRQNLYLQGEYILMQGLTKIINPGNTWTPLLGTNCARIYDSSEWQVANASKIYLLSIY